MQTNDCISDNASFTNFVFTHVSTAQKIPSSLFIEKKNKENHKQLFYNGK